MQPDADPERPRTVRQTTLINLRQYLPRRLNRVAGSEGIVERRAKYFQKPVAQKFVDEAPLAVDRFDHECKAAVEELDHCRRRAVARVFREVADVEKHHADLADVTCELRRTVQQALDDRWRHVLAKEVGDPLARDRLFERTSELRAQPERDQPGYRSGDHHEHGLDDMVRA